MSYENIIYFSEIVQYIDGQGSELGLQADLLQGDLFDGQLTLDGVKQESDFALQNSISPVEASNFEVINIPERNTVLQQQQQQPQQQQPQQVAQQIQLPTVVKTVKPQLAFAKHVPVVSQEQKISLLQQQLQLAAEQIQTQKKQLQQQPLTPQPAVSRPVVVTTIPGAQQQLFKLHPQRQIQLHSELAQHLTAAAAGTPLSPPATPPQQQQIQSLQAALQAAGSSIQITTAPNITQTSNVTQAKTQKIIVQQVQQPAQQPQQIIISAPQQQQQQQTIQTSVGQVTLQQLQQVCIKP